MGTNKSKVAEAKKQVEEVKDPKLKEKLRRVVEAWEDPDSLGKEEIQQLAADAKEQGFSTSLTFYDLADPKMKEKMMEFLLMKEAGQLVKELEEIIALIDEAHLKASKIRVASRSLDVVGTSLSLSGMVVGFVSAGLLLPVAVPLLVAGAVLNIIGSITRFRCDTSEVRLNNRKTDAFIERYQRLMADFGDYVVLRQLNEHIPKSSVLKVLKKAKNSLEDAQEAVEGLVYTVLAALDIEEASAMDMVYSLGQTFGPTAAQFATQAMSGAAANVFGASTVALEACMLVYDVGLLIKDAMHLANNETSDRSNRLRNIMERLKDIANGHFDRTKTPSAKPVTARHLARLYSARRKKYPLKCQEVDKEGEEKGEEKGEEVGDELCNESHAEEEEEETKADRGQKQETETVKDKDV